MPLLTIENLIKLCEEERQIFSDIFIPLTSTQSNAIQRCLTLVKMDPATIKKNRSKLWAQSILMELHKHCPELFILTALSTYPSTLGTLKKKSYLQDMMHWWHNVEHPESLTQHANNLLASNIRAPPSCAPLGESDLIEFLQAYSGKHTLRIRVPDDEFRLPAIEISREMCQDLIRFVLERTGMNQPLKLDLHLIQDDHLQKGAP